MTIPTTCNLSHFVIFTVVERMDKFVTLLAVYKSVQSSLKVGSVSIVNEIHTLRENQKKKQVDATVFNQAR